MEFGENLKVRKKCPTIISGSKDICVKKSDCDLNIDIRTESTKNLTIWGHVKDDCGRPVKSAFVRLLKYCYENNNKYKIVCSAYTDSNGFYQFNFKCRLEGKFRIVVSKNNCETQEKEYCDYKPESSCNDSHQNNCSKNCYDDEIFYCQSHNNINYY